MDCFVTSSLLVFSLFLFWILLCATLHTRCIQLSTKNKPRNLVYNLRLFFYMNEILCHMCNQQTSVLQFIDFAGINVYVCAKWNPLTHHISPESFVDTLETVYKGIKVLNWNLFVETTTDVRNSYYELQEVLVHRQVHDSLLLLTHLRLNMPVPLSLLPLFDVIVFGLPKHTYHFTDFSTCFASATLVTTLKEPLLNVNLILG